MRTLKAHHGFLTRAAILALALAVLPACGDDDEQKPTPDAGPEADAGTDAGTDAYSTRGWYKTKTPAGSETPAGFTRAIEPWVTYTVAIKLPGSSTPAGRMLLMGAG